MKLQERVGEMKKIVNWLSREHVPIDGMFEFIPYHPYYICSEVVAGKIYRKEGEVVLCICGHFLGMLYGRQCFG